MKGVVKAVKRHVEGQNRRGTGFFFIVGEDGVDRFAHASNVAPPLTFDEVRDGQTVEFEPIEIPGKGLRADRVRLA